MILPAFDIMLQGLQYYVLNLDSPPVSEVCLSPPGHISDLVLLVAHCCQVSKCHSLDLQFPELLELVDGLMLIHLLVKLTPPPQECRFEDLAALLLEQPHHLSLECRSTLLVFIVAIQCDQGLRA